MLHYPLPRFPVSQPARQPMGPPTLVCRCCGDTMDHSRTILKFGVRFEQLIFVCPSCKAVDTKVLKPVA
jgi:hypothetical protein